jgi:hypothetical protein
MIMFVNFFKYSRYSIFFIRKIRIYSEIIKIIKLSSIIIKDLLSIKLNTIYMIKWLPTVRKMRIEGQKHLINSRYVIMYLFYTYISFTFLFKVIR